MKMIGKMYRNLSPEELQKYKDMATANMIKFLEEFGEDAIKQSTKKKKKKKKEEDENVSTEVVSSTKKATKKKILFPLVVEIEADSIEIKSGMYGSMFINGTYEPIPAKFSGGAPVYMKERGYESIFVYILYAEGQYWFIDRIDNTGSVTSSRFCNNNHVSFMECRGYKIYRSATKCITPPRNDWVCQLKIQENKKRNLSELISTTKEIRQDEVDRDIVVCEDDTLCGQGFDNMINDIISEYEPKKKRRKGCVKNQHCGDVVEESDIVVGDNDILCPSRGLFVDTHPGNVKFRKLVAAHKLRYLAASKSDKSIVAREVVKEWRTMTPPGRFLKKKDTTDDTMVWQDVGDKKAREKTSQRLCRYNFLGTKPQSERYNLSPTAKRRIVNQFTAGGGGATTPTRATVLTPGTVRRTPASAIAVRDTSVDNDGMPGVDNLSQIDEPAFDTYSEYHWETLNQVTTVAEGYHHITINLDGAITQTGLRFAYSSRLRRAVVTEILNGCPFADQIKVGKECVLKN